MKELSEITSSSLLISGPLQPVGLSLSKDDILIPFFSIFKCFEQNPSLNSGFFSNNNSVELDIIIYSQLEVHLCLQ